MNTRALPRFDRTLPAFVAPREACWSKRAWAGLALALMIGGPTISAHAAANESRVVGGRASDVCAWPTALMLQGGSSLCSATLVHPKVAIYAAHCGTAWTSVFLGEQRGGAGHTVATERCEVYPGAGGGQAGDDYAFCILAEELNDVMIVPPLMGEDLELLKPGQLVWAVGFGINDNESQQTGIKHEVELEVTGFEGPDNQFIVAGGGGKDGCNGDSGGPLYIELPNSQGWRVFGITSYGPSPCGPGGAWAQMHLVMSWFEEQSGVDLTPCHDAMGNPDPDERCKGFPLDPGTGGGSWEDYACEWGAVTPDGGSDSEKPAVEITAPSTDSEAELGETVTVKANATDDTAVQEVELMVDGKSFGIDDESPYSWDLDDLAAAKHTLQAVARDAAGNEATSATVEFEVIDSSTSSDETTSSTGDEDDDDDDDVGDDDDDSGTSDEDSSDDDDDDATTSDQSGDSDDDDDDDDDDSDDSSDDDDDGAQEDDTSTRNKGGCQVTRSSGGATPLGFGLSFGLGALLLIGRSRRFTARRHES